MYKNGNLILFSVLLFTRGRVYEYKGPREKENIVKFIKEQAKPPSEEKVHMLGITNNMDRWKTNCGLG